MIHLIHIVSKPLLPNTGGNQLVLTLWFGYNLVIQMVFIKTLIRV